jgi:MFS family permease
MKILGSGDFADIYIAATAIPRITDTFHSLDDVGWYGSAYFLTQSCFQLHFGKLYKHFSGKWVLLSSITIFEIGSLVCATSPDSPTLIVG